MIATKRGRVLGAVVVAAVVTTGGYAALVTVGDVPPAQFDGETGFAVAICLVGGTIFGLGYYARGFESLYHRQSEQ